MKKSVICFILLFSLSCKKETAKETTAAMSCNSAEQLGKEVVASLQHQSLQQYLALGPGIADFQSLIESEAKAYGLDPQAYKEQTNKNYESYVLPALTASFEMIRKNGNNIQWGQISYTGVQLLTSPGPANELSIVPLEISFSDHGNIHKLLIKKALLINGKWMISQFIQLN